MNSPSTLLILEEVLVIDREYIIIGDFNLYYSN